MQEESQNNTQQVSSLIFPEKSKNNHSVVYLIIIFILLAIIGFLSWKYVFGEKIMRSFLPATPTVQVTATPTAIVDPTANWKTYKSNKHNFSLKYPSSWYSFDGTTKEIVYISNFDPSIREPSSKMVSGEVKIDFIFADPEHLPFPTKPNGMVFEFMEVININGIRGQQLIQTANEFQSNDASLGITKERKIFFDKGTDRFLIGIYFSDKSEKAEKLVNQILSTFKFTEK